jgi:hypothetical protein
LLKKTSLITKGIPDFSKIKDKDFKCIACDQSKAVRRPRKLAIPDPPRALDRIEGDTLKISPIPYNKQLICLFLVNRKTRYKWVFLLPNKEGLTVYRAIKGFFRGLKNQLG